MRVSQTLSVEHIDSRVFLLRIGIVIVGSPDVNSLVVAAALERHGLEIGAFL